MRRRQKKAKADAGAVPLGAEFLDLVAFARRVGWEPDEKQADLLRRDPRRCLLNCTRQWGKSTLTATRALYQAYFYAGSLTLVVSPSARQSAEFLRKAQAFAKKLGVVPRGDGDNEISLALENGSRIVGLPGKEATIRGFSAVSLLLIDEAARVPDELYRAVRPMLAVGKGALWLMSTPHGRRGFFYEEWVGKNAEWERVEVPATECPRIPAAYLEEELKSQGQRWFEQEYLCQFHDSDAAVFTAALVDQLLDPNIEPLTFEDEVCWGTVRQVWPF